MREHEQRSLTDLLGHNRAVFDPTELIAYAYDAWFDGTTPGGVIFPQSPVDVVRLVHWAREHRTPLVARGAGTGLSGGAVAVDGGLVVEFAQMDRLLALDRIGRSALVEPGLVNLALDERARTQGLYYPPDPSSGRASTLGGNIAENAGGPHCFKHGVTTNYVLGLNVVLADGRSVQLGGPARDYPEYDLCGLVTGSEGTLGIITKCLVRLIPSPPAVRTLMAVFDSIEQAGEAVSAVIAAGLVPATLEMMDQQFTRIVEDYAQAGLPTEAGAILIAEVDGYPASLESQIAEVSQILRKQGGHDLWVAQTAAERDRIWFARKSAAGAMARLAPAFYAVDGTVPRSRLTEALSEVNGICARIGLPVGHVFHAGDGNLHPAILIQDPTDSQLVARVHEAGRSIADLCSRLGGSITGEHGVGIEKRDYMPLMYSTEELRAMQDVKEVFDPQNLLNPGKIFPAEPPPGLPSPPFTTTLAINPVCLPTSTEEAADLVRACTAAGKPLRIHGGGTKSRGLPRTEVLLDTSGLRGIKTYAPADLYITVGAGSPLSEIQDFLAGDGMQIPLASPWPESTVGGIVAANANAPLRMRYGSLRDLVLSLTVVLGDGRVIRAGRPVVKNVAGYDLPKIFVGSHGTLGLITEATLKLCPLPRARRTLLLPVEDLRLGLDLSSRLLPSALVASAILLCKDCGIKGLPSSPYSLCYTAEGWPEDVEAELAQVRDLLRVAGMPERLEADSQSGTEFWREFLGNCVADTTLLRLGIPPRELPSYLQEQSEVLAKVPYVADLASGLLYVLGRPATANKTSTWIESLRRPALALKGYAVLMVAPEDTDLDRWGYEPPALDLQRCLKSRWDPANILNPGAFIVD